MSFFSKKTLALCTVFVLAFFSAFAQKAELPPLKSAPDAVGDIVFKDGTALPMQRGMLLPEDMRKNVVAVIAYAGDGTLGKKGLLYGLGVERSDYITVWAARDSFGATNMLDSISNSTPVKVSAAASFDPESGDINGIDNWDAVCAADPNATAKPSVNYPVFNYANNYGKKHGLTGDLADGWYVPTVAEFCKIYASMKDINAAIASTGKEVSLYETALWTSSQSASDPAKVYAITSTRVDLALKTGLNGGHILVLHTFGKAIEEPKAAKSDSKKTKEPKEPKEAKEPKESKENPKQETPKAEKAEPAKKAEALVFTAEKRPDAKASYSSLDKSVKAMTFAPDTTIADAAKQITAQAQTPKEKIRALYTWICANIKYDAEGKKESGTVKGVWQTRAASSQGYSLLFKQMAKDAGIKADSVAGIIKKNSSYKPGDALENHFWNVAYDGKTPVILDIALTVNNGGSDFVSEYFDVDPGLFVFTHFPKSAKSQGVAKALTKKQFESSPFISLRLEDLGVRGQELLSFYQSHTNAGFPEIQAQIRDAADAGLKIKKLPATGILGPENSVFNFEFPQNVTVQLVTPKGTQKLTSGKDYTYSAAADGSVKVNVTKSGKTYTVFTYESKK